MGGSARRRTPRPGRARKRPSVRRSGLLSLSQHITARDVQILHLIREHRFLDIHQLTDVFFDSYSVARRRMLILSTELEVVDRFRPRVYRGSSPFHYVLAEAGARIIAADRGIEYRDLRFRTEDLDGLPWNPKRRHTSATNSFFAKLIRTCRSHPPYAVLEWINEASCKQRWPETAEPDGFCYMETPVGPICFAVEIDRGTESPGKVAAKLLRYASLALAEAKPDLLAFSFPDPERETAVRKRLYPVRGLYTVTTSVDRHEQDPIGNNWLPIGSETRLSFGDLARLVSKETA
ncbi:MAG: replication-relaxation family protein [Actinomycetota bacterium]